MKSSTVYYLSAIFLFGASAFNLLSHDWFKMGICGLVVLTVMLAEVAKIKEKLNDE